MRRREAVDLIRRQLVYAFAVEAALPGDMVEKLAEIDGLPGEASGSTVSASEEGGTNEDAKV